MITKFKLFENEEDALIRFGNLIYGHFSLYENEKKRLKELYILLKEIEIPKEELNKALLHVSTHFNTNMINLTYHMITYLIQAGANPNAIVKDFWYGKGKLIEILYSNLEKSNLEKSNFDKKWWMDIILHLIENGMEWTKTKIIDPSFEKRIEEMFPEDYKEYLKNIKIKQFKI